MIKSWLHIGCFNCLQNKAGLGMISNNPSCFSMQQIMVQEVTNKAFCCTWIEKKKSIIVLNLRKSPASLMFRWLNDLLYVNSPGTMPDIKCLTNVFYYYYCFPSLEYKYGDISYLLWNLSCTAHAEALFLPLNAHHTAGFLVQLSPWDPFLESLFSLFSSQSLVISVNRLRSGIEYRLEFLYKLL